MRCAFGAREESRISYTLMPLNLETHGAYKTGRDSGGIIEKALHMVHTRKEEIQVRERSLSMLHCLPYKTLEVPG